MLVVSSYNVDLLKGAKIEYVNIPANEQLARQVPVQTSMLIALSANAHDNGFLALLTRFGGADTGYVQTIIRDHATVKLQTNASRTAVYISPTYAVRGMIVTVNP